MNITGTVFGCEWIFHKTTNDWVWQLVNKNIQVSEASNAKDEILDRSKKYKSKIRVSYFKRKNTVRSENKVRLKDENKKWLDKMKTAYERKHIGQDWSRLILHVQSKVSEWNEDIKQWKRSRKKV